MNKRIPILIGLILLAIATWLMLTTNPVVQTWISQLNELSYDTQLKMRVLTHYTSPGNTVVIVDIDDRSLKVEGQWPWPRSKVAALISRLQQNGAVVIALDIMLSEAQTNIADALLNKLIEKNLITPPIQATLKQVSPDFDEDAKLAKVLAQSDTVLGISLLKQTQIEGQLPPPILQLKTLQEKSLEFNTADGYIGSIPALQIAAKNGGFLNVFSDSDGIIRRAPLLIRYQNNLYPSLALEAVRLYLLGDVKLMTAQYENSIKLEGLQLGENNIPTDQKGEVLIPFIGRSFTFTYYSAIDVLNNTIPKDSLAGKIVFIGTSATGLGDIRATAIEGAFPGVEIQAAIAEGLLTNKFSYRPAWADGAEFTVTIILGIIVVFLFPYLGPRLLSLFIIFAPISLIFANNILWERTGLIISLLIPIIFLVLFAIMNMIYGYLFESRRRERLKTMFGQYVPKKHIDTMLKSSDSYGLYGEDRDMTVLFADIRNFTTISEPLTATQLKELLNAFFTPMTEIIFKNRGTIDKYVGDLIMAFWGAPLNDKKHALHAVESAIEMQETVKKLQSAFADRGWPEIKIGIGVNSGVMSVGDMGSRYRRNYTVLGDAVNLASRIESLTKFYGAPIIVTEFTQKSAKGIIFRKLDKVRVKGKQIGVVIYEAIGHNAVLTPELRYEIETSDQAVEAYFNQEWNVAKEIFTELYSDHPYSTLYKLYLERIAEFEKAAPPANWDGIYIHTKK